MNKPTFITILILLTSASLFCKSHKDIAEDFKSTGEKYEKQSKELEQKAKTVKDPEIQKLLLKQSEYLEDMADIKYKAARYAKKGKFKRIDWNKYKKLEKRIQINKQELMKLSKNQDKKKEFAPHTKEKKNHSDADSKSSMEQLLKPVE